MNMLILTDFSAPADHALAYIAQLAKCLTGAVQISLLHVLRDSLLDPDHFHLSGISPEHAETQLQGRCAQVQAQGISCTTIVGHGRVVPTTRTIAAEVRADVIVLSKRNTEYLPDELVDSFSLDLLRHSAFPLLVIPAHYHHPRLPQRALLAIAGDTSSRQVSGVAFAQALLATGPAEVRPVLIAEERPTSVAQRHATTTLHAIDLTPQSAELEIVTGENVVDALLQQSRASDLLIAIAQSHGMIGNLFHDSYTAHLVQHTHVPLLVLRA